MAGLTVNNGTASGDETGTLVTVTADTAPPGTQFVGWSGDLTILANPFIPTTTVTIPFMAVTITATYTAPATNLLPHLAPRRLPHQQRNPFRDFALAGRGSARMH